MSSNHQWEQTARKAHCHIHPSLLVPRWSAMQGPAMSQLPCNISEKSGKATTFEVIPQAFSAQDCLRNRIWGAGSSSGNGAECLYSLSWLMTMPVARCSHWLETWCCQMFSVIWSKGSVAKCQPMTRRQKSITACNKTDTISIFKVLIPNIKRVHNSCLQFNMYVDVLVNMSVAFLDRFFYHKPLHSWIFVLVQETPKSTSDQY